MKKKKRNLWMSMMLLLPVMAGVITAGSHQVKAAEEDKNTVNITLNKKAYDEVRDDKGNIIPPTEYPNTGLEMDEFKNAKPLPGVTFKAYNVTEDYTAAYKAAFDTTIDQKEAAEKAAEAAKNKLMSTYSNTELPSSGKVGTEVTDANGQAKFTDLTAKSNGIYQAYMFFETAKPANVSQEAAPMLVVLPVENGGKLLTDIQLYPKNVIKNEFDKQMVGHEKETTENGLAVGQKGGYTVKEDTGYAQTVGDKIQYYVDFTVPNGIGESVPFENGTRTLYDKLTISDKMNVVGTTFNQIDSFTVPSENNKEITGELKDHYTLTNVTGPVTVDGKTTQTDPSGFTIAFNLNNNVDDATSKATAAALEPYAGQTLRVYYTITINEFAVPDVYMQNGATYEFKKSTENDSHKDESKAPKLIVGGRHFKKIDGSSENGLAGAEFIIQLNNDIKNNQGQIVGKAGQYVQYTEGPADKVNGLGTGAAQEIYNPATAQGVRYVDDQSKASIIKSGENGNFEVKGLLYAEEDAYALIETKAPEGYVIVKEKTDFTINAGSYGQAGDDLEITIINNHEGFLPGTGGNGIYAYLAVGALVVAAAGFWFVRSRKNEVKF
ncbi:SpaH/EbpB family LPXTG-anchored major pilin [uncultured Enterococcus sp.]|uniref:SpaH/EbpB family LPXTG-anchored major pilin n=1 Tax=uncultured Enterococcus sp. TaxID=167972 RepID=UPI0025E1E4DE|nr:SpaH/EbpB family LPXTG-anchored major pilin [uncultured Enterococcus sp.]